MLARVLLSLAAGTALVAQSQSTFYSAYEDAVEAMGHGRWREASLALNRAIHLRPRSGGLVQTYGTNLLSDYYPYVRLARCYLELGELEGARRCLVLAERQGEPRAQREVLEARLAQLTAPPPQPAPPRVTAPVVQLPAEVPPVPEAESKGPFTEPPPPRPSPGVAAPPAKEDLPSPTKPLPAPTLAPKVDPLPSTPALPLPGPRPLLPRHSFFVLAGLGLLLTGILFRRVRQRKAEAPEPGAVPERVGPYQVLRRLGRGGFATTYLARHDKGGDPVALKVPHPHLLDDAEAMQRFHQEALLGATLDHPNLVRVLDPGPVGASSWMAFEYVEGPVLEALLAEQGALPLPVAVEVALAVAEALAHAHAHGIVHRDLKPANILMSRPIRVMDFGIARLMDTQTLTTTYAFLGTPRYAAPEAQLKTGVGPAADRYSLGILLFEMLAGQPPFEGDTPFEILERHRRDPLPEVRKLRPEVPEALARLMSRLARKEPDERPEDAEVIQRLRQIQAALQG